MPLVEPTPGIPVSLSHTPDSIALVERVAGTATNRLVHLRLQDGSTLETGSCSRFFEAEIAGARMAFGALVLARACVGAGNDNAAQALRQAVGQDIRDLPYLAPEIARTLIVAAAGMGSLARNSLGDAYGGMMAAAKLCAGLVGDLDLQSAAALIASDGRHRMPTMSWPGASDPRSAEKDRAVLDDGILPNRKNRSFFCGAYDVETGEIKEVVSYAGTGYGELHHGEFFSRGVASRIDRGLYGYFVAHETGNVYAHWRVARGQVAEGAFAFLAEQFTVGGERPRIFEEMQRAAGEAPWYAQRTDPENDKPWESGPSFR